MTIVDEIFQPNEKKADEQKSFNKEQWALQKQEEREEAFKMIDQSALETMSSEEQLKAVLDVIAHFDRYSVGNALLIAKQKPDATKLADYDKWKDAGVHVKKGESGILILGPGQEYEKSDGTTGVNYTVKKVFDISQTSAEKQPESHPISDARQLLKSLIQKAPCTMSINEDANYPQGKYTLYDAEQNIIFVRRGGSETEVFQEVTQHIVGVLLDKSDYATPDRNFIVSCASYVLCKRNHLETPHLEFEKLKQQANFETPKSIRISIGKVRELASDISKEMKHPPKAKQKSRDSGAR